MVDRNKKLAIIHIARKQVGLDEQSYRALLLGAVGFESARELKTEDQYRKILHAFKSIGFRFSRKRINDKQLAKCYAIWTELWRLEAIGDRSYRAMKVWINRQLKTEQDIFTVHQKNHLIEELKAWRERVEAMG